MTHSQAIAIHTYPRRRKRKPTLRRTLHFMAFLLFWAVVLSVFYLVTLAVLIVCILLA
jgi:hypothetical protein